MNHSLETTLKNVNIKTINYLIVFFVLYLSSSFYALSIPGFINIILMALICILSIFVNFKDIIIKVNSLFFFIFIVTNSAITYWINDEDVYNYAIFLIFFLAAYLIYLTVSMKEFILIYSDIMYFLCTFSIFTFIILFVAPSIFNFFPEVHNSANLKVSNVFFSVVHKSDYFNSNFGMFWEPGAFQTFINLALFIELFVHKETRVNRMIIYLITVFTTFSTTGYIGAFLLIVLFLLRKKSNIKEELKKRRKIIVLIIILVVIIILVFGILPDHIKFKVFGKLEILIKPQSETVNADYSSTIVRLKSINYPLEAFIKNPMFGVGFDKLYKSAIDNAYFMVTSTPVNWFALFGIFAGATFNICLFKWTNLVRGGILFKICLCAFLLIIIASENYNRNAFFLLFLFYSFDIKLPNNTLNKPVVNI
ncbi:O-antigen ligase family protein [Paenibacillus sp. MCAF9]|uniref:O-antigen ligase family protein n=1 Tax=Paenibacillus sp. MCAF9 TaxID=3233046 RepID=UPI003F95F191